MGSFQCVEQGGCCVVITFNELEKWVNGCAKTGD